MVLTATSAISPIATSFSEVTQALAQDQHSLRIKKLLLFACTQIWENDPQQLDPLDLPDLLRQLLVIAPTLEQLQSCIYTITNSLNKSAEYTLVANTIINRVSKLYLETSPLPPLGTRPPAYEAVAQLLAQDQHSLRIKKLLLLTCRNVWEADATRLNLINFSDLVREAHSLTPTLESLKAILDNLVKTLSKPTEYGAIAGQICLAFQPLYLIKETHAAGSSEELTAEESTAEKLTTAALTHRLAPSQSPVVTRKSAGNPADPDLAASHVDIQPSPPGFGYLLHQDPSDLFDLRLEILQSANPLQVKIVLFSLLHEVFEPGTEHDLMLKNHELDDLLRILLQTHPLLSDLKSKLLGAAQALGDSGAYVRVAQVILQAVKSFYAYLPLKGSVAVANGDENATDIVSVEASLPGTTEPDPPDDREATCQVSLQPSNGLLSSADLPDRIKT
ncbi:MAG TPA: hypothetical protein V6C57_09175 [Coleofasciculaceae cyanobacterium]